MKKKEEKKEKEKMSCKAVTVAKGMKEKKK